MQKTARKKAVLDAAASGNLCDPLSGACGTPSVVIKITGTI